MANSQEKRNGKLREGQCREEEAVLLGQLHRDRLQRENKLDTDEDKTNQRMRRNQWIRTDC